MFPDEESAKQWFENILWPDGTRYCPECASVSTYECKHAKMPYRCRDCGKYFSVKTGTVMAGSPIPLLKWLYAIYLDTTSLKGVSSMKLHRDLSVTQKTAWFMQQRIREAFAALGPNVRFGGPVEVDESYFGGRESNKHESKKRRTGRGTAGKTAVAGLRDRPTGQIKAEVVPDARAITLQGFVAAHTEHGATVYTDDAKAYRGMPNRKHEVVKHSAAEYVSGQAHTNGAAGAELRSPRMGREGNDCAKEHSAERVSHLHVAPPER